MKKNITLSIILVIVFVTLILFISINKGYYEVRSTPTTYSLHSYFSAEANGIFDNIVAKDIDLNSGITMERALPLYDEQINNVTFAVFNHTNESILFPNQGFGLAVFRYDEITKIWENLQLPHVPFPEPTTLRPMVESWSSENNKSWSILEDDTTALGYKQLRLYVLGRGEITNTAYGAYLDVIVSTSP